jgi:hypothetical protein
MAVFPDWLYKLTARDQQVTPLEIYSQILTGVSNAAGFWDTAAYTVPAGKILLLQQTSVRTTISTAAYATVLADPFIWTIFSDNTSADPGIKIYERLAVAPDITSDDTTTYFGEGNAIHNHHHSYGGLLIPENYQIYARTTLGGANALNVGYTTTLHVWGLLIPRGNFAI